MPFCDLSALKAMMRIPSADTSRDAELQIYVDYANGYIYGALGGLTESVPTTYTDTFSIDESYQNSVITRRYPMISVTSVVDNGNTLDPSTYSFTDLGVIRQKQEWNYFMCLMNLITLKV